MAYVVATRYLRSVIESKYGSYPIQEYTHFSEHPSYGEADEQIQLMRKSGAYDNYSIEIYSKDEWDTRDD